MGVKISGDMFRTVKILDLTESSNSQQLLNSNIWSEGKSLPACLENTMVISSDIPGE